MALLSPITRRVLRWSFTIGLMLLSVLAAAAWVASGVTGSSIGALGIDEVWEGASLRVEGGALEVQRFYAHDIAESVPQNEWHETAVARGWVARPRRPFWAVPWFAYSSGHVSGFGVGSRPGMISPAAYWVLAIPLWALVLPGMFVAARLAVTCGRGKRPTPARGFEVEPAATTPPARPG